MASGFAASFLHPRNFYRQGAQAGTYPRLRCTDRIEGQRQGLLDTLSRRVEAATHRKGAEKFGKGAFLDAGE